MAAIVARGDFIGGRFVLPTKPDDAIEQPSPADLSDVVGRFPISRDHIEVAINAARSAQSGWQQLAAERRFEMLRRFGEELKRREALLVALLGREVGKPAWEAKTEVSALISKIEITINEGMPLVRGFELDGGRLACRYRPLGVLVVIGPFNFPLHLAHGHIVPALATGNTVVFKPSEVAPACAQIYAEAAEAAGFPAGVLNVVQGKGDSGAALTTHPGVDGILFTGSLKVGARILAANAQRPGRMVALEMGGKNHAIVLADAPWDKTLHDVALSAFATAGQRCTAVSRIVVVRAIADRFCDALVAAAMRLTVGRPTDPKAFMGPLATRAGLEKFQVAQKIATREGAVELLPTHEPASLNGYYATPSIHRVVKTGTPYTTEEIFGPDVSISVVDDLEEAYAVAADTPWGLAAGVFTASEEQFEACAQRLPVGCLTWNAPTVGSSSRLPFGGLRDSGNHRPAALFSTLYCTAPVAVTKGGMVPPAELPPGMGAPG